MGLHLLHIHVIFGKGVRSFVYLSPTKTMISGEDKDCHLVGISLLGMTMRSGNHHEARKRVPNGKCIGKRCRETGRSETL
jgi:hypothetical protein